MLEQAFWIIMCDMAFGIIQWLLILRFIYGIFLPENSRIPGVQQISKFTDPIIALFGFLTHSLVIHRVKPLYVALYFAVIRFYILPTFIGYEVYGFADLTIEAYSLMLYQMIGA